MSKLDFLLWRTNCYSEVSRGHYRRCSVRTPFLQNTSRLLLLHFCKDKFNMTNLKNVRQTKVPKRFIYGEKKQSIEQRETNSNASYSNWRGCLCDNWKLIFLPLLIFDWCTFSRRVTARWWCQSAKNQVSTNQKSRNRWCLIVRRTICVGLAATDKG